jgi:hypothetical protein
MQKNHTATISPSVSPVLLTGDAQEKSNISAKKYLLVSWHACWGHEVLWRKIQKVKIS